MVPRTKLYQRRRSSMFYVIVVYCCLISSCCCIAAAALSDDEPKIAPSSSEACNVLFPSSNDLQNNNNGGWDQITIAIHHNGNPNVCGTAPLSFVVFRDTLASMYDCTTVDKKSPTVLDKYHIETLLTEYLASTVQQGGCGTNDDNNNDIESGGLLSFCDMGPEKTVIQNDHDQLVRVASTGSLPCRWFTREGLRISSLDQLSTMVVEAAAAASDNAAAHCPPPDATLATGVDEASMTCGAPNTIHLYGVPTGRVFMFAPSFVGETFTLSHVRDADDKVVSLQVLSLEPRVFDIYNFFNQNESTDLVEKALQETSETYKFHRSTTGTSGASVFNKRTSENAWDTHGRTALIVKKRCFWLLGIDEYDESMADGLQILRYNLTTAYTGHLDYLEDKAGTEPYDYDSSGKGGNRFATILLYFTDLGERDGGETVFPNAWPHGVSEADRIPIHDAIAKLRASGDADMLKKGSWEEEMTALCRSRFSIRPHATRAVLFYSQFPNGELDRMSHHGGCPVLRGTKLAANLWTWSGIRPEYEGAPLKFEDTKKKTNTDQIHAIFSNTRKDKRFKTAELYYDEDGFFGKLGFGEGPVAVNTYAGHKWNIKVNGETLKTFVIEEGMAKQTFDI